VKWLQWLSVQKFVAEGQVCLPVWTEPAGHATKLVFTDGSTAVLPVQAPAFCHDVARYFRTTLPALRSESASILSRKQLLPLPFSRGWVLVPFRVCIDAPSARNKSWLVARYILDIRKGSSAEMTEIQLHDTVVTVYHSPRFCAQQLQRAAYVERLLDSVYEQRMKDEKEWQV
jgi:hypothetical protein